MDQTLIIFKWGPLKYHITLGFKIFSISYLINIIINIKYILYYMIAYIIHNASDMKFIHSFSYNLKIQQREVMPYNKTHMGGLLEE